jgi:hypothetical protein
MEKIRSKGFKESMVTDTNSNKLINKFEDEELLHVMEHGHLQDMHTEYDKTRTDHSI